MPIFEYQCGDCGQRTEIIHPSGRTKRPRCAACNGVMKKVISPAAFILKGSGWYVTDYPSQSRKEGMESEKKAGEKKKEASDTKKTPSAKKTKSKKGASSSRKD